MIVSETQDRRSTPRNTRHAINVATWIVIGFTILGFSTALTVYSTQQRITQISTTAHNQIELWQQTKVAVLTEIPPHLTEEKAERLLELRRLHIRKLLAQITQNRTLIIDWIKDRRIYWILRSAGYGPDSYEKETEVLESILDHLNTLADLPSHTFDVGLVTLDSNLPIILESGAFLTPLRTIVADLERETEEFRGYYLSIFLLSGALVIISTLMARNWIILPTIERLATHMRREDSLRQTLSHQAELANKAIYAIKGPVSVFDGNGKIELANSLFRKTFFPMLPQNTELTIWHLVNLFDQEPRQSHFQQLNTTEAIANALNQATMIVIRGRRYNWNCSPIQGDTWVFIAHDITAAHIEIETLQHRQRLEALGKMAGGVAHDFNNILAAIRTLTDVLKTDSRLPEPIVNQLDSYISATDRGRAVVSQLLSYSRRQPLSPEAYALPHLAKRLIDEIKTPANIFFRVRHNSSRALCVDIDHFITAIENLVVNASNAIGPRPGLITLTLDCIDETITLVVDDTGSGFSGEALSKATEPFFTTRNHLGGTGLGLAMVAGFVAQSQGEMILSNHDHGARITIRFPAATHQVEPFGRAALLKLGHVNQVHTHKELPSTPPVSIIKRSCLLVEDNPLIGKLYHEALLRHFTSVTLVDTCKSAIYAIEEGSPFDAALLDWSLLDGTSEMAILALKKMSNLTQIVLTTGYLDDRAAGLQRVHQFEVLLKPCGLNEVLRSLGCVPGTLRSLGNTGFGA